MPDPVPSIKGIFINSHIDKLRSVKGSDAIVELEFRFGRPIDFADFSDYPVRDEITIIEHVLDLLAIKEIKPEERAFEAGRLHFRDFIETEIARVILSPFSRSSDGLKKLLLNAGFIARRVFKNTNFTAHDGGDRRVVITMENNDYPIDHFRGFFHELMLDWGLKEPHVIGEETAPRRYEYSVSWGE